MNYSVETVTFLFTDIEGSTKLWSSFPDQMSLALDRHNSLAAGIVDAHHGLIFKNTGDGICAAFRSPVDALQAAISLQQAFVNEPWEVPDPFRIRMALHSGLAQLTDNDYKGLSLSRVARVLQAAHGGQILISEATHLSLQDYMPTGVTLLDLGVVRLRGLQRPERIHQVCAANLHQQFPPLRSLDKYPHNIPVQLTSFVGRNKDLHTVVDRCRKHRLVTLTGPGGCGKTRLSLQAAAELVDEYPLGVWLVELASLTDPDLIASTVSHMLGLREESGRSLKECMISHCESESILLILDNCEHLIDACAAVAEDLLSACPGVHILATSRERLNISGECTVRLTPLSSPAASNKMSIIDILSSDAGQLFVERAVLADHNFALSNENVPFVGQICRRVEGLPLAVELAAARVRALSVQQIAERLDKHFRLLSSGNRTAVARHQTLEATVGWSYDLLTEAERTLLVRLSVFSSGWTLEAAEGICSDDVINESDVVDLLDALVTKSLVTSEEYDGQIRYRLLETIRVYARGKLTNEDESGNLTKRLAYWYGEYVEKMEPDLRGPRQTACLNILEREHDNMRTALTFLQSDPSDMLIRLASTFYFLWARRGPASEGIVWLGLCLNRHRSEQTLVVARTANRLGILSKMLGDFEKAETHFAEAKAVFEHLGDQNGVVSAMNNLAMTASAHFDYDRSRSIYSECLKIYQARNDHRNAANVLNNLGAVAIEQGDLESGMGYLRQSIGEFEQLGDKGGLGIASRNYADAYFRLDMWDQAVEAFLDCLDVVAETKDQQTTAEILEALAHICHLREDCEGAAQLCGKAFAIRDCIHIKRAGTNLEEYDMMVQALEDTLGEATWLRLTTIGANSQIDRRFVTQLRGIGDDTLDTKTN